MKKRFLSLLLVLCMVLSLLPTAALAEGTAWDGSADTSWYNETDASFTLTTAEQLAGLATLVNSGNNFYAKTVSLGADIVLNGSLSDTARQWTPIGTHGGNGFAGTFDGRGHTVSGLYINNSENYQALFGSISAENERSGGTVRNLGVVNGAVTCSGYGAGIVGQSVGTIANCYSAVKVTTGNDYAAGIVANTSSGYVRNCYNIGAISGSGSVGGIAPIGYPLGEIKNCFALSTAVPGATSIVGSFTSTKGYLLGYVMGGSYTGDYFSDAAGTLSGGGTLPDKLNAWVEEQDSSDYYTWQIASGVNGGYPVQGTPLSTTKYAVTIAVNKDGSAWTDSGKSFTLKNNASGRVITTLTAVNPGSYRVLDGGVDTGAAVTVTNTDAAVEINYYTVSGKVSDYAGGSHSVVGLTVQLYADDDTGFATPLAAATTAEGGHYSLVTTPGSYVARVAGVQNAYGAGTANVTVANTAVADANITLSQIVTQSIAISSTNHKIAYRVNDALDVSKLEITVAMSDGATKVVAVTADMVKGFDFSTVSPKQTLTITYDGKTTTYDISVGKAAYTGEQATAPIAESKTEVSIKLTAQSITGETVEYAKSNSATVPDTGWKDSTEFTGLNSGTNYYFFARVMETAAHAAGTVASAQIRTVQGTFPDTLDISAGNIIVDQGTNTGIKVTHGGNIYDDLPAATEITVKGTSSSYTIKANISCNITLAGVAITPPSNSSENPMNITSGTVTLTLQDGTTNTLKPQRNGSWSGNDNQSKAGLRVPKDTSLIINGNTGKLLAQGGGGHSYDAYNSQSGTGAGIGGNGGVFWAASPFNLSETNGTITINGGAITALAGERSTHYGNGASGIGAGGSAQRTGGTYNGGLLASATSSEGIITINGGTVIAQGDITANGAGAGSGIGASGGPTAWSINSATTKGIVINGGNLKATHGDCASNNPSYDLSADPTSNNVIVYKATFTVPNDTIGGVDVSSMTFTSGGKAYDYNMAGAKSILDSGAGKVYVYLPAGSATATYGDKTYKATVTKDNAAVFTEYTPQSFTATASISGYTYGGTVSTPSVSTNPGSGAVTYYYNTTNTNKNGTEWKGITATTLDAGDYYLYAVISAAGDYLSCTTEAVKFTVAKADQSTPAAPAVSGTTTSGSITVTSVIGQMYFCQLADSAAPTAGTPGWTKATAATLTFSSLSPNRSYDIYTYIPGSTNDKDSSVSAKLTEKTASAKVKALAAPTAVTLTKYYTTGAAVIPELPGSAKATLEGDGTQYLNITWTAPATYNKTPGAENAYTWSVSAPTNYTFDTGVVSGGSITVTNKAATPVTITATTDAKKLTRTYAGTTFTVTDLFSIDSNAGTATYSVTKGTGKGTITAAGVLTVTKAGTFTVGVKTAATGNYAAGNQTAELTISKGTGSGTVTIADWVYGGTAKAPTPTSTTNGITGVTYSYAGVSPTSYTASATAPTAAGSYQVTATFAATDLYEECTAEKAFTIAKAPVSFTVSGNSHDYDTTAKTATVTQTASQTPSVSGKFAVTYQKDTETATADQTNVGEYKIIVTLTDDNFKFNGKEDSVRSLTLTDKLAITAVAYPNLATLVLPTAGSLTYGQKLSDSALTSGDTGCTYAWKTGTTVPTVTNSGYAVVCTPKDTNYAPFEKTVSITVSKVTPSLTLPAAGAVTYGQTLADSALTGGSASATYNGVANTDIPGTFSWSAKTTAPKVSDSGKTEYEVTFTPTDTGNYNTATGSIKLTVNPRPVTLTWEGETPFTYDGAEKAVTATVSNPVGTDLFTLTYSANSKTDAGSYTAAVTALGNDNYTLTGGTNVSKEWKIAKAPISFVATDNSYPYDAVAHKATVAQKSSEPTQIAENKFAVTYKLPTDSSATEDKTKAGVYDIIITLSDDNFCFVGEAEEATRSHSMTDKLTIIKNTVTALWKNTAKVYTGSALSPELSLVGLQSGDDNRVSVQLSETYTEAGTYTVTAELTGENSANYTLTNPTGTFIIQKAPVSFTLSGNSVKKGERVNVIATSSVPGVAADLTYWKNGKQVQAPTDAGSYDVYAAIANGNYRHVGGTDGTAQRIGVLTIYEAAAPATYTVSFDANGGSGSTGAMTAAQAGTVRVLPASGFQNAGKTFAGWKYGTQTYQPGERFTQPSTNITLKALWNEDAYSIGGVVVENENPAANAVVTLMLGSQQIGQTVTNAGGEYSFTDVVPGVYNLVACKNGVTQTILVTVADAAVADQTITMPGGKLNSVVEVKAGSPAVVVGDLEKAFTEQDKAAAQTQTVELKLTAEAKAADSANDAQQAIDKQSGSVGLYLDFTLTKTVNGGAPIAMTTSPVLLTAVITLPAELQGKDSYTVYRFHEGKVQTLSTAANADGEKIEVSKDKTTLTVYTKSFSLYAVKGVTYSGNTDYTLTFHVNGGSAIAPVAKSFGITVDLSAYKPTRAGYTFAGWYSDSALTKPVASVEMTTNIAVYAKWTLKTDFTDIPGDAYYHDAVLWAVDNGITFGTSATTFNPDGICTRAQTVTFLWRAMGSPEPNGKACPFTDVKADEYYYKAVLWATEKGITKGTSATSFSPERTVTRSETVTFLHRTAGNPAADTENPFRDVKSSAYYYDAVLWAAKEHITSGTDSTLFSPIDGCTRAQIVTFLYRYLSK